MGVNRRSHSLATQRKAPQHERVRAASGVVPHLIVVGTQSEKGLVSTMQPRSKSEAVSAVPTPIQPPLLVTVREASRLLSVSPWEVRRLVRRGVLGVKKLSKTHWLISTSSLQKFAGGVA
jgi:excisionase family DNA binding protein